MLSVKVKTTVLTLVSALLLLPGAFADSPTVGAGSGLAGARYATDAYPGFDCKDEVLSPERKEPRWFSFIFGPNRENAADQFAYCEGLIKEGDFSKAAQQLDALVRGWPTAPEAPRAQLALADILSDQLQDYEEAFAAYRYLLDFYSLQCDYGKVADKLYEVAGKMKETGKEIMFVRFANTVDVRRAYEACVLHAPGAVWVPAAMLTIVGLREEEGKPQEAIKVCETLRNIRPESDEAQTALAREADIRMTVLREFEYNRDRCHDTIAFMEMALTACRESDKTHIRELREETRGMLEGEAYRGAKFYDSATRTKRSAISAYEKFIDEYPNGVHADEVRQRLEELKGGTK